MFSKTLFINLILIALVLLGTWYTWQQLASPSNTFTTYHEPDAYATHVIISHTDTKGNLYDQLTTPLLIHYPSDNRTLLFFPVLSLVLNKNEAWQLSSRYGKLNEDKSVLHLWNNVKLEQRKDLGKIPTMTLKTSTLDIDLTAKIAHTAAPILITQPNQEIHATGLSVDFNTKTIQLLSQVKGKIKPEKNE